MSLLVGLFAATGCTVGAGEEGESKTAAAGQELFTETFVDLKPDGNHVVRVNVLTRDAVFAEHAKSVSGELGQQKQAITTGGCTTGVRLYAEPNQGPGSSICFTGQGIAHLGNYCRLINPFNGSCADYWSYDVQSYRPGSSFQGGLGNGSIFTSCTVWAAGGPAGNVATSCTPIANQLMLLP